MTTYNTGNPVGSPAPKDLYDNAENLDTALHTGENTWVDRLGNTRTSWAGATGYQILGDYAGSIEITERNQVVREGGEYWRLKGSVDLPYTTTGTWAGDDETRFISVGDAVLRSELALDNGGELIGTGAVTKVSNVTELRALTGLVDGQRVSVASYRQGHAAMASPPVGGGEFEFYAARSKSDHDGALVISPTVPWGGTDSGINDFIQGVGETDPAGKGCWVKIINDSMARSTDFGIPQNVDGSDTFRRDVQLAAQVATAKLFKLNLDFDFYQATVDNPLQLDVFPGQKITSSTLCEIRSNSTSYGADFLPLAGGVFPTKVEAGRISVRMLNNTASAAWRIRLSYSELFFLGAITSATTAVDGYHFEADDSGSGPYYNEIRGITAQGPQDGTQTSTGVKFVSTAATTTRYPNANVFIGGRVGGYQTAVRFQGAGNEWYSPRCEGNSGYVFDFSANVANSSTDNKVFTAYIEGADGVVPMLTNADSLNCGVSLAYVTSIGALSDAAQWSGDRSPGCFYSNGVYSETVRGSGASSGEVVSTNRFEIKSIGATSPSLGIRQSSGGLSELINSSSSSTNLALRIFYEGVENFRIGGSITGPSTNRDNAMSAGSATGRYSVVYAGTGTINTSDANEKQQIRSLDEAEKQVGETCKSLIKAFKFNDAVEEKGEAARIHVGVVAQDVEQAFIDEGLDPSRYAVFCRDVWWEIDGEVASEEVEGATRRERLGIRLDQLMAFIIGAM